jgi:hypothetical protein
VKAKILLDASILESKKDHSMRKHRSKERRSRKYLIDVHGSFYEEKKKTSKHKDKNISETLHRDKEENST